MPRGRRLSGGVLSSVGLLFVISLALSTGLAARGWTSVRESAQERLAQIEAGISELGGKVLDTASSLAVTEIDSATPTPTLVVVIAALPEPGFTPVAQPQTEIVLAPTTVGAVGGTGMASAAVAVVTTEETSAPAEPSAPAESEQPTVEQATTAAPAATEPPTPTIAPTATEPPTPTTVPTATEPPAATATPTITEPAAPLPTPVQAFSTPTPDASPAAVRAQAAAPATTTAQPGATAAPAETATATATHTATVSPTVTLASSPAPLASPTSTPQPAIYAVVAGTASVNLRSGPGREFALVGSASPADRLLISRVDATGSWLRLSGSSERWVSASLVDVSGDLPASSSETPSLAGGTAAAKLKPPFVGVVNAPVVNIRSGPGTNFAILSTAKAGERLPVIGLNAAGDWAQLSGSSERWVLASVLDLLTEPAPIE